MEKIKVLGRLPLEKVGRRFFPLSQPVPAHICAHNIGRDAYRKCGASLKKDGACPNSRFHREQKAV